MPNQSDKIIKKRRFGLTEIIFAAGIVLLTVGGVYYLVADVIFAPVIAPTITGQKISIPAGWEMYSNKDYGFSIAHPSFYKAKDSHYALPSTAQATDRSVYGLDFEASASGSKTISFAPLSINVSHQTLDQAVSYAKSNILTFADPKFKLTVTNHQSLSVNGHQAYRIDVHKTGQTVNGKKESDSDFTNVYVESNGLIYNIATEYSNLKPFDDSNAQTMYKSFTIK